MGMLDQCPVRICGVGTVFCDPALRDRSHARVLVEQLVHEAGRNGADLVLVFCPPDSGSHAPDGFDVMPAMEVELTVKEPSRYGAPMMLVVRHVIIFGHGHGLQRAIIDESQHRTPERLIMAQH